MRLVRVFIRISLIAAALVLSAHAAKAGDVTLAWDANAEPDVMGYWIVYRTSAQTDWTQSIDVGNRTSYTIGNLHPGQTYVFSVMAYSSYGLHSDASTSVSASIAPIDWNSDFDGDGFNDLLWQNREDGSLLVWRMEGTTAVQFVTPTPASRPDLNWEIAGIADFNHDGKPDIVWYNDSTGALEVWLMNGLVRTATVPFNPATRVDPSWRIVSVADIDGDTNPDLVWRNLTTGALECWKMNGTTLIDSVPMGPGQIADPDWDVTGTFDVNGDGKRDMVWVHRTRGTVIAILMDGTRMIDSAYMDPDRIADHDWVFAAYTDINADGKPDMIWQHSTKGWVIGVLLNGLHMLDSTYLSPATSAGSKWRIAGPR